MLSGQAVHFQFAAPAGLDYAVNGYRREAERHYQVLDDHLAHLIHQEAALRRCRAWGARVCCGLFILVEAELEERVGG